MVHLDTSALVDALTGPRRSLDTLAALVSEGHRLGLSAIVLYEWLRGPRTPGELASQDELFPEDAVVPFGSTEGRVAAGLYKRVRRGRGRETDLAIAACALVHNASLWTLNPSDFRDIPDLSLV
jgi:predicted nucleic acid-binding protein